MKEANMQLADAEVKDHWAAILLHPIVGTLELCKFEIEHDIWNAVAVRSTKPHLLEAVRVAAIASECTKVIKAYTASMVEKKMGILKQFWQLQGNRLWCSSRPLHCTSKPSFSGSLRSSLLDTVPNLSPIQGS